MIDKIQTLKNLNERFPRYKIETLLNILDCYAEVIDEDTNGVLLQPKKLHNADKTSSKQQVTI